MNQAVFQPEFSLIALVYAALLIFGIAFNALVAWSERNRYLEGYTAFAVALGVGVTIAGIAVLDIRAAALTLGGFAFSGAPMIVGSLARHALARRREQEYVRQTARMAQQRERGEE